MRELTPDWAAGIDASAFRVDEPRLRRVEMLFIDSAQLKQTPEAEVSLRLECATLRRVFRKIVVPRLRAARHRAP
jgi:hypothetical protein